MNDYLEEMQTKIRLTPKQEQICYPTSELEHVSKKRKPYKVTLNSLPTIKMPLPLPDMITEWGLTQLILKFTFSEIINILVLLLIEQSVLIIGHSHEEVSACTLAFKSLLHPYTWPNVIIPLLPEDIMDIVSSPVPYIIGIVATNKTGVKKIENDMRVKAHMDEGLTVINLTSEKIIWTTCREINDNNLIKGKNIM